MFYTVLHWQRKTCFKLKHKIHQADTKQADSDKVSSYINQM